WYYGYYNLTADPDQTYSVDDFLEFVNELGPVGGPVTPEGNHWTGAARELTTEAMGPWTMLGQEDTHPNGTNSAPNEEHWTIRRWVSDFEGPVTIHWHIRATNTAGGAGTTGILFVNGVELDRFSVAGTDGIGVTRA